MLPSSRLLASATALCLFLATPLSAIAVQHQQAQDHQLRPRQNVVNDWVTVDRNGIAHTITASVTTENGVVRTVSPAPYALTGSVFTVTRTDGTLSTSTGRPPPPQATGSTGEGVFASCHGRIGTDAPFCQPRRGSDLYAGMTYYVTWDPEYFGVENIFVQVTGWSVNPVTGEKLKGGEEFFGARVPSTRGFYSWTVDEQDLNGKPSNNISLHLVFYDPRENQNKDIPGPAVVVHRALPVVATPAPSGSSNLLGVFIAVPIVAVLLFVGVGAFFWVRRRKKRGLSASPISIKRASSGYGVRKSHSERVGKDGGTVNIKLSDSPTSPTPGRNVFQEELRRQELERDRA